MNCSRGLITLLIFTFIYLVACKDKKKASLSGDEPVDFADFAGFFQERKAPMVVGDTTLQKKDKDSLLISSKVFSQFVPDSVVQKTFGKSAKVKIFPIGQLNMDEKYLFAKVIFGEKRAAFILAYDKKDNFIAGRSMFVTDDNPATQQTAIMDNRSTLTINLTRKNKDGSQSDGKDVYALNNDSHAYTLIMTDALDDVVGDLINPIDTFPRKQKFTADYGSGKTTLLSVRDGRREDRLSFFIHFEKSNGECTGELKGEAIIKSASKAIYTESGDPCSLEFNFTNSGVTVKELGGCGSRRGLRCSFDGVYARKKDVAKPTVTKIKKSTK